MRHAPSGNTNLQIISQIVDMPRVEEPADHIRRFQEANGLRILLDRTGKIALTIQMITVLFEYVGQAFGVVIAALRNAHRDIVQIFLE